MVETSNLTQIVNRIRAMMYDNTQEIQTRQFNVFGVTVATVIYDQPTQTFAVEGLADKNRRFAFDDADLVAIEVYEALLEFRETF